MTTNNDEDWDLSLPTPEDISEDADNDINQEECRYNENINKLKCYVEHMAYRKVKPVKASPHTESLAKPKKKTLDDNVKQFTEIMVPPEKGHRLKRLSANHNRITIEQLEKSICSAKASDRRNDVILKRKDVIYYELLTKLEIQCQTQYLNFILKKFGNLIAKLSTTMRLPSKLFDPYARMQRGLYCNILQCIGIENCDKRKSNKSNEGIEYAVCYNLSHALLSLIIKALDLASTRNSNVEALCIDPEYIVDNYIKDRLIRAAEKKILRSKRDKCKLLQIDALDKKI